MYKLNNFIKESKNKKIRRFIFFGLINALFTNLILQIMLIFSSTLFAAFLGQLFNFNFGYYIYGKKVFIVKSLKKVFFIRYLFLHIFLWNVNWLLINYLNSFNLSKNFASFLLIPWLALISFLTQKGN